MAMTNINFMMEYVKEFLDGKKERLEFDLDFSDELMNRWDKIRCEDEEHTLVINEWLAEDGLDAV